MSCGAALGPSQVLCRERSRSPRAPTFHLLGHKEPHPGKGGGDSLGGRVQSLEELGFAGSRTHQGSFIEV